MLTVAGITSTQAITALAVQSAGLVTASGIVASSGITAASFSSGGALTARSLSSNGALTGASLAVDSAVASVGISTAALTVNGVEIPNFPVYFMDFATVTIPITAGAVRQHQKITLGNTVVANTVYRLEFAIRLASGTTRQKNLRLAWALFEAPPCSMTAGV